jgi:hypothetical protein
MTTALLAAPVAQGAPGLGGRIDTSKARKAAAEKEVGQLAAQLASQTASYVAVTQELQQTRVDIMKTTNQIDQLDKELLSTQARFDERVDSMYRSGGLDTIETLLGAKSFNDLIARTQYLTMVNEYDAGLIEQVQGTKVQAERLQQYLSERLARQQALMETAEVQRTQIMADLAAQQQKASAAGADLAAALAEQERLRRAAAGIGGAAPPAGFDPDNIISDAKFTAADAMSEADIQNFLNQQSGSLKSLSAPDHNGNVRTAAQMIAEAARGWGISPMAIMATLQKEQSLISEAPHTTKPLDWAMGCGRGDSFTTMKYKGFGNQIWWGASKLQKNRQLYAPGKTLTIDGNVVRPANGATFGLYRYTPHMHGNISFWMIYWRYFGDPR